MRTRSLCAKLGAAAVLMLAAGVLHAQDGLEGAVARLNRAASFAQPVTALSGPTLAAADFDGDNKPDGAVLLSPDLFRGQSNPQVELHFTARNNADITLAPSDAPLSLIALDIDHDGDVDLIVEQSLTHKRLQIFINDGHGDFSKGRIEDYPLTATPAREQLSPPQQLDGPALSLPPQRGSELSLMMSCHIAGRPPSAGERASSLTAISSIFLAFSPASTRAPPLTSLT
jgi:hypothetical protein